MNGVRRFLMQKSVNIVKINKYFYGVFAFLSIFFKNTLRASIRSASMESNRGKVPVQIKGYPIMALKWSDVDELANALEKLYPQTDLSVLEYDELRAMVAGMDGFDDASVPDDDDMEAVIRAWVDIQFPEDAERVNSEDID